MHSKNILLFSVLVVIACVCVDAQIAIKKKAVKSKIRKNKLPLSLPACGCQNPLFDILSCGCRGPLDAIYTVASLDVPVCGCQKPVIDMSSYRYVEPIEISGLGYLSPIEIQNFGCMPSSVGLPSIEYISPLNLPCGCQGPSCGCRAPAIQTPAYPYGTVAAVDVPNRGCQELILPAYTYGAISSVMEIPSCAPQVIKVGCGCLTSPCGCQSSSPCGCAGPVCTCQSSLPCGCPGPICGCQAPLSCGCPGPLCGCQNSLPCGCTGPLCGCPISLEVPSCGLGLNCGCGLPNCGCGVTTCGCEIPGCMCGGTYLRQVALQPPFL